MNSNLLLEAFFVLSKKELNELSKWIKSPFFNQREDIVLLFEYLRGQKTAADFNNKEAFDAVFLNEMFDLALLRHTMSFLYKQIKDFIAYKQWQKNPEEVAIKRIAGLREYACEKGFLREINKEEKQIKGRVYNAYKHFNDYLLQFEKYEHTVNFTRVEETNLQQLSDKFSLFFICETLRLACLTESAKIMIPDKQYNSTWINLVCEVVEKENLLKKAEVAVYYFAYKCLKHREETNWFYELKALILQNSQKFEPGQFRAIYLLAINYCIKRMNAGEKKFAKEVLDLYEKGLETKILLNKGKISKFTYNNVITLALITEDYIWAEDFLEEYKSYLPQKDKRNTYLYNLTNLRFKKGEYEEVLDLLNEIQFRDTLYNLNTRRMQLCSYYELGEFKALDSVLDSFQVFLSRRNDLGYHKLNYLNLVKLVRKLLSIRNVKEERAKLKVKIEETKSLAYKDWLLSKLD